MKTKEFHTKFTFNTHNKGRELAFGCKEKTVKNWHIIAVGSGWGAQDMGTADGPKVLLDNIPVSFQTLPKSTTYWHEAPVTVPHEVALSAIEAQIHANHVLEVVTHVHDQVKDTFQKGEFPLILGGDHSIAIGTWSAITSALGSEEMGLIWVDAHLDAHTFHTTPSQNIHGMPVAVLLGHGDIRFTSLGGPLAKLKPQNVCIIGARSFEEGEADLLSRLGVRVYSIQDVRERGFETVFQEARSQFSAKRFGLSLDVDAFDPEEAPGTGTPERSGLHLHDVRETLKGLANDPALLGLEIVEFNPHLDVKQKTCQLAWELASLIKGGK